MCNSHIVHAEKSHREEPHFGDTSGHQSGTKMRVYMEKERHARIGRAGRTPLAPRRPTAAEQQSHATAAATGRRREGLG